MVSQWKNNQGADMYVFFSIDKDVHSSHEGFAAAEHTDEDENL